MAAAETAIVNDIMKSLSRQGVTLFRNVRGMFLTPDGKRKVAAGLLAPGASDLIGFRRVVVTPEMVGKTVAVAVFVEVKTKIGRVSIEQSDFISFAKENGAIAGVCRSSGEAENLIREVHQMWSRR